MKKLKVVSVFWDKYTKEKHEVGSVVQFEDDRATLALEKGYVELIPEKPKAKKQTQKKEATEEK